MRYTYVTFIKLTTNLFADELHDHVPDLLLYVHRLVAHGNLGQSGQVN